jgi:hypothetical protein
MGQVPTVRCTCAPRALAHSTALLQPTRPTHFAHSEGLTDACADGQSLRCLSVLCTLLTLTLGEWKANPASELWQHIKRACATT